MQPLATVPGLKQRRRSELGLMVVGLVVVTFAYVLAALGTAGRFPSNLGQFVLVAAGLGLVVHLANRRLAPESDPVIMPIVLVLNGLGYVMIYRLNAYPIVAASASYRYQAVWSVIGVAAYVATLAFVRRSRDLERYRYLLVTAALILLVLPLAPYFDRAQGNADGVDLWIRLGPISFQPVEIAKLMLVVFFASYFVEKREMLSLATRRVGNRLLPDLRPFGPIALAWVGSLLVILFEHDIGFSLLLFVMFIAMLWTTTGRFSYVVLGIIAFLGGTYLVVHVSDVARILIDQRITGWLHPWKYPLQECCYQVDQAQLAMARGGAAGTGLGLGDPGLIPVVQSDMIFAAFGEELGLLGATAIVVGFLLIVGAGVRAAIRARSEFSKLLAVGLTTIIGFQTFFIIGGVLRLLPLTGVTLPFVSYGGSSLLANYVLVGLLMRVSDEGATQPGPTRGARKRAGRSQRRKARRAERRSPALLEETPQPVITTRIR